MDHSHIRALIKEKSFADQGSIIEFVIQLLYQNMIDPKSNDYLPKLVPKISDPSLAPYSTPGPWNLTNLSGSDMAASADQICIQATPPQYSPAVGMHAAMPNIALTKIVITGLTNVQPEKPVVTDPNSDAPKVSVALDFCTITGDPTNPPQISITGNFHIVQNCCVPTRGASSCAPGNPTYDTSGDGTFTATLARTGPATQLQMINHAILVTIDTVQPNISTDALTVAVLIDSGSPHREVWEKLAEEALNNDSGKHQIIAAFAAQLTDASTLGSISAMITQQINNMLG
jgi:hypothetical protein